MEEIETYNSDEKKPNWKKLLSFDIKRDWYIILMVAVLVFIAWAYKQDMQSCYDIIEHPKKYCDDYCDTRGTQGLFAGNIIDRQGRPSGELIVFNETE